MLLSAVSLYIVALPIVIKLIGMGMLLFYSYLLYTHVSVTHFIYLGSDQCQCELSNGMVYLATLADDSIFLRWFILMRFVANDNQQSYSIILFKGSEGFILAQRIRQQVLFNG